MTEVRNPGGRQQEGPAGSPTPAQCREALAAVLTSKTFRPATGQRALLKHIGDQLLAGEPVKEYSIGVEVFDRGDSFDPRIDPIVRVMAHKLRAGLDRYYREEGRSDPVIVELPKGSYVPAFSLRSPEPLPAPVAAPPEPQPPQMREHVRGWSRPGAAAATLAVVAASAALYLLSNPPTADAPPAPSIAVLPFATIAGGAEDGYLADGLTGELIESLERVPGLRVAGRASAFRFRGKSPSPSEAGEELHAHTLLMGLIRRSNDGIHLTVQLVNAANGYELWAATFDPNVSELPAIVRVVSQSVINVLGASPAAGVEAEHSPAQPPSLPNAEAYQAYLKGRHFWSRLSEASLNTTIGHFKQAIALDPTFARAYAGLAHCYAMMPQLTDARTPEMCSRVRKAAGKALELDRTLGEAHVALALAAAYEHDWASAEQEYRTGLALNPGNSVSHLWFGGYLALRGRLDEALMQRRLAVDLDPLSPYALEALGRAYYQARRYDDAIAQFRRALEVQPDFGLAQHGLGRAYLQKRLYAQAIDELLAAQRMLGATPRRKSTLAYAYAVSGRPEQALRILDELRADASRGPVPAVCLAEIYLGLGQWDQALDWLQRAVDQKDIISLADPIYDFVRSDPRFVALGRANASLRPAKTVAVYR